jgi:hypothetical protein
MSYFEQQSTDNAISRPHLIWVIQNFHLEMRAASGEQLTGSKWIESILDQARSVVRCSPPTPPTRCSVHGSSPCSTRRVDPCSTRRVDRAAVLAPVAALELRNSLHLTPSSGPHRGAWSRQVPCVHPGSSQAP